MGYIGRGPVKSGAFRIIDDVSSSFNGSTTGFTIQHNSSNITPGTEQNLLIAVDGVMQEPVDAFTISGSTITFTSAPASGASFWGVELGDVGGIAQTIANGTVDSSQIVNGSIDRVHLAADIIDGTKIADDVINSEHYAAASIDNEHLADDAVGADELAANAVVNASIASGAAIAFSKMENLTASRLLVSDGSGDVSVSAVTSTEVGYLDRVSSAIQTQLGTKSPIASPTFTTGATSPTWITGTNGTIKFNDSDGSHYFTLAANATTTTSVAYTWPVNAGTDNYVLTTNGSGVLTWEEVVCGTTVAGTTDNALLTFVNSGSTFAAEANLTFDGSLLLLQSAYTGQNQIMVENTSTASGDDAKVRIKVAAGSGDAFIDFTQAGSGLDWAIGLDSSAQEWKVCKNANVTSGDVLVINASSDVEVVAGDFSITAGDVIQASGKFYLGDTSCGGMTQGLVINQGAHDDEILALKSSDVSHGFTSGSGAPGRRKSETDTFGMINKYATDGGGLSIHGYNDGADTALCLQAFAVGDIRTDKDYDSAGLINIDGGLIVSNTQGALNSDANMLNIRVTPDSGNISTRFIFDQEGSGWSDIEWTTFDDYNDVELMRGMMAVTSPSYQERFGQEMMYNLQWYEDNKLVGRNSIHWEDRPDRSSQLRGMVNFTGLAMLHHSTIVQMADNFNDRFDGLENQLKVLQDQRVEIEELKQQILALGEVNNGNHV